MPRGRYRDDDDWSGSEDFDFRFHRRPSRHRSSVRHEQDAGPNRIVVENQLFVPGVSDRRPSRSRSRRRSESEERRRPIHTEDLGIDVLAQLQLGGRQAPISPRDSRDDRYEYERELDRMRRAEDDRRRDLDRQIRQAKLDEEDRKDRYRRDLEDDRRSDKEKRERLIRELEDEKRREDERYQKALKDAEEKERKDKEKREKMAADLRAEEEKKKKEAKENEERILLKAKLEAEEKKAKDEELRKKILHEEAERIQKEKDKKKKEDQEFEDRIRERAIKAGMDPDKMLRQLRERSPGHHSHSSQQIVTIRQQTNRRPVKVRRDHILPETLDEYRLRWNYSSANPDILIIEEEVDDEFLYELQVHSDRLMKSRKLITPGYVKNTVTTLTPAGGGAAIKKKHGQYYMVRKRSVSRGRGIFSDLV